MEKVRRAARIAVITKMLTRRPGHLFPLGEFSALFGAAKSTISEDLLTIKQALAAADGGVVETVAGAAGGVRYWPYCPEQESDRLLAGLCAKLQTPERIIPGGFLYMTDILCDAAAMVAVGDIFFTKLAHLRPDYIFTVETKGIPLALMTARSFNRPLVVARHGSKVTEGPSVSINYVSGSSHRIETMTLPRRALPAGARVLVIDDFMKAGGTIRGMLELIREVGATAVGAAVLMATATPAEKLVSTCLPLLVLHEVDEHNMVVRITPYGATGAATTTGF